MLPSGIPGDFFEVGFDDEVAKNVDIPSHSVVRPHHQLVVVSHEKYGPSGDSHSGRSVTVCQPPKFFRPGVDRFILSSIYELRGARNPV